MKVSLNTVKQFTQVDLPVDELVHKINQQLGGVEEVTDLGKRYENAVIAKVVKCEKHPNADKLSVCVVDDGGAVKDVTRNKDGHVQVVCGAPNVHADMFAVWLPPKSTVPASFNDVDPFVLDVREIRGVLSNGMLAASDELAIGSDHAGIVELTDTDVSPMQKDTLHPGASFAKLFGLDDTIIDIENKMFTHRPDLFGQIGVAREIAGIQHLPFTSPTWYTGDVNFKPASGLELRVVNDASEKVPRLMAVAMKDVAVARSPLWLQCTLVAMGSKPINNIVDVTNYVMLMTGQPTHAYDYDKLSGHKLGARMAKKGEKLPLLNGKTYELDESDIVIVDGKGPVGLGGIMGGGNSEVSDSTKNIVLEVANFDMYAVRKSSMRHGLFTDALTRFNKGQSPLQNDRVMALLMQWMKSMAGGEQASDVYDEKIDVSNDTLLSTSDTFINDRLGLKLGIDEITSLLRNVEVPTELINLDIRTYQESTVDISAESSKTTDKDIDSITNTFSIENPFWRTDLQLPEDIVEEVGRLYGFDKLPRELPQRSMMPAPQNPVLVTKQKVRGTLSRAGASEVLTYSFVHEKVLKNAQQDPEGAFKLSNALSPDLQYYRISVLPSLLQHVHANIKSGHDKFALFEIGKGHHKSALGDDNLPIEFGRIAGVYASKQPARSASYFQAKRIVAELANDFGLTSNLRYQKLSEFDFNDHEPLKQMAAPFDMDRAAMLWVGERFGGIVGELKQSVIRSFKLPQNVAAFELFVSLFEHSSIASSYTPLSRYPSISQDISLKVSSDKSYESLYTVVQKAASKAASDADISISPVSIYQAEKDKDSKTVTFHVQLTHHDRTLKETDASKVIEAIATLAGAELSAVHV